MSFEKLLEEINNIELDEYYSDLNDPIENFLEELNLMVLEEDLPNEEKKEPPTIKDRIDTAKTKVTEVGEDVVKKFNTMATQAEVYVDKVVNSITNGLQSAYNFIKGSEDLKAAGTVVLKGAGAVTAGALAINKTADVLRSGDSLSYIMDTFKGHTDKACAEIQGQGKELKNAALKGAAAEKQNNKEESQKQMGICQSILKGIKGIIATIGGWFASLWACLKKTKGEKEQANPEESQDQNVQQQNKKVRFFRKKEPVEEPVQ